MFPKHFQRLKIDIGLFHSKYESYLPYYNSKPEIITKSSGITMKTPEGKVTDIDTTKDKRKRQSIDSVRHKKLKQMPNNKRIRDSSDDLSLQFKKLCLPKSNNKSIKRCAIDQLEKSCQKPKITLYQSKSAS